ncbi:MAG TPA: hypothetical protein VHM70_11375 [Polyangiaceae bacterium]|jgi:hypothetical protein|nr:hypothetical protein [Polyangiaceae bacterium]
MKPGDTLPTPTQLSEKRRQVLEVDFKLDQLQAQIDSREFQPLPPWHRLLIALPNTKVMLDVVKTKPKMAELVWKGGSVRNHLKIENTGGYSQLDLSPLEMALQAQSVLAHIVEPEVLAAIPVPTIYVVQRVARDDGVRAQQNEMGILVDAGDDVPTVVHELGHYLEWNIASLWAAVVALRERRHVFVARESRVAAKTPEFFENREEMQGRYHGNYPATGPYTSKVYEETGATELVSLVMEHLATPERALELMRLDPILLLTVLRPLRPRDNELHQLYLEFKDYLPAMPVWGPFGYTPH